MIEILVTIAILVIGLWGLMEMQTRLQISEMESYQRTQALMLVDDMANRIGTNRRNASLYVTVAEQGAGVANCATPAVTAALEIRDEAEWCAAIKGAAEQSGGTEVGALVGGRGCVKSLSASGVEEYMVIVVWQGLTPIAAPPAEVDCGENEYDIPVGSACAAAPDFCRRYVSRLVRIADLTDL
ncbi:MAG: hypothetical protein ABJ056_04185 [Halioglobus sp.]